MPKGIAGHRNWVPSRAVGLLSRGSTLLGGAKPFFVPGACLLLLFVLLAPMPAAVLDVLLCVNIALAMVILLAAMSARNALEFSSFPTLLLGTTLLRLVVNIATTRMILGSNATTPHDAATSAGVVVSAFGHFVAGGNLAVGGVIFLILVVVQFVVITKGASRVAEVAARFTLDAMPGKQSAIDGELAAGHINAPLARSRRERLSREAEFFGAMDGASKFVRGDAVAGLIITVINLLGGVLVGIVSRGWGLGETAKVYTILTIGDGLAAQLPAFLIAIAAGLLVTRCGSDATVGEQATRELSAQPVALFGTAAFLALLALTPLPALPLLGIALVLALWGAVQHTSRGKISLDQSTSRDASVHTNDAPEAEATNEQAAPEHSVPPLEMLELELGLGLLGLAEDTLDAAGGVEPGVLTHIALGRRTFAEVMGMVVPSVRVRDNARLRRHEYTIRLRGGVIGCGIVRPGALLAIDTGHALGEIAGEHAQEPVTGKDAWWIDPADAESAVEQGYEVTSPAEVIGAHLDRLVRRHADELLTREHVAELLEGLRASSPRLVEEAVPSLTPISLVQSVLRALVREGVPIRDLETILETLATLSPSTRDASVHTEFARNALRRTIVHQHAPASATGVRVLRCVGLTPEVTALLAPSASGSPCEDPLEASAVSESVRATLDTAFMPGEARVLVAPPPVRAVLRRCIEQRMPDVTVLGTNETVPGVEVRLLALVPPPGVSAKPPRRKAAVQRQEAGQGEGTVEVVVPTNRNSEASVNLEAAAQGASQTRA